MAIKVGNSSVCLEDVLGRVSEVDILSHYCNITEIPCVINSPLREDKTPSFGFYTSDGRRIHWIDYATNDRGGTFDLLMKMYLEEGYSKRDAAQKIIENNIFGLEIDKRAFQLAYFAFVM